MLSSSGTRLIQRRVFLLELDVRLKGCDILFYFVVYAIISKCKAHLFKREVISNPDAKRNPFQLVTGNFLNSRFCF